MKYRPAAPAAARRAAEVKNSPFVDCPLRGVSYGDSRVYLTSCTSLYRLYLR